MSKVNLYTYVDYRQFLRDAFAELKKQNKKFSFRYFSKEAGFKSQSVLKLVMDGQMNLSVSSIETFARVFKLNKSESEFFYHLVMMNQAKSGESRAEHAEELLKFSAYKKLYPLSQQQLNYYRHWYYVPIREMVVLGEFREDPEWIARRLNPRISVADAARALMELEQMGLIKRNKNGRLEQSDKNVSTGDEVVSKAVVRYHHEMIKKAAEAIDRFHPAKRDISSVTISVSKNSLKMIKEKVQKFRKELLEAAAIESSLDQVFQVNVQIFPLCQPDGEDEGST